MIPRLSSALRGSDPERVHLSETGQANAALRTAWAGYYADRALLVLSLVWIVGRAIKRQTFAERPEVLYDPLTWLGALAFPAPVSTTVWGGIAVAMAMAVVLCLWRPRLIPARVTIALCALLLMSTEFAYGKIEHTNHLFLLAHVYAIFLPVGRPSGREQILLQAEATRWYQGGLLLVYTMAGLWKFGDMTLRAVLKPGMTWLHPEAMPALSALSYRVLDFNLAVPQAFYEIRWLFPIGYVAIAFLLVPSALAPFRRPLLLITLPTVALFHLMNALTLYAIFLSTIVVALVLFVPYDLLLPIRRTLAPVGRVRFKGAGGEAHYERLYENGDVDRFEGFYAYRERLTDRSWILAAPLYYPGVATVAAWVLQRRA
ncbi:MAG: hypothetical protein HKN04_12930 [Rhodothermaceae bacterium]|nr:hypothetical protein [Rhodothermaceae bacterium]